MSAPERSRIRVLVVDDSVVARRAVANVIETDPDLEVVGFARDGKAALAKLATSLPHVVVLDLMMPEMDGFQTLRAIRADHGDLPVIVFSSLTARGASETLQAMTLGASGFVLKPTATGPSAAESIRAELLPLIKALATQPLAVADAGPRPARQSPAEVDAIVVAISTGGPNALAAVIGALPAKLPVPVLIVQHMPPVFTATLARRLNDVSVIEVSEGTDGELVRPGHVYIAPGGHHMGVFSDGQGIRIDIHDGPMENSTRPAADVLFRSAASTYGAGTLAVVMTGMGSDGLRGTEAVVAAGGSAIVQDQQSCVVGSMPAAVAAAGLADAVLPLGDIAAYLVNRTARRRRSG